MKEAMKHTLYAILTLSAILALSAGCQQERLPLGGEDPAPEFTVPVFDVPEGEMPFFLKMDGVGTTPDTKGMLFGPEVTPFAEDAMQLLCFDRSGYYVGIRQAHIETGLNQFWGYVPDGTARIHFVVNANLPNPLPFPVGTSERIIMQSENLTSLYSDPSVKLWGYHMESNASAMKTWLQAGLGASEGGSVSPTPNVIHLLRDRARVRLSFQSADIFNNVRFGFGSEVYTENVSKIEWTVTNGRDRGYIAPYEITESNPWANYCNAGGTASTVSMNEYTQSGRFQATEGSFETIDKEHPENSFLYLFDDHNTKTHDEAGRVRLILKLTSVNSRVKYILILLRDGDGNQIQITRNNTYILNIKSLQHEGYPSLAMASLPASDDFANNPADVDPSVPTVSDGSYTLSIVEPTATNVMVKVANTVIPIKFTFMGKDGSGNPIQGENSSNADAFTLYWEENINSGWDINDAWDINNPGVSDDLPTFNSGTGQWEFNLKISSVGHTYTFDDHLVIRHKKTGLYRTIHVYAVDEFKYRAEPVLSQVMNGTDPYLGPSVDDTKRPIYKLSFKLSQSLQADLFPISIHIASNTLQPYNDGDGGHTDRSNKFGIITGSTAAVSSSSTNTDWNYNASNWGFYYEYILHSYPTDGLVELYLKDIRNRYTLGDNINLGLFLRIKDFPDKVVTP